MKIRLPLLLSLLLSCSAPTVAPPGGEPGQGRPPPAEERSAAPAPLPATGPASGQDQAALPALPPAPEDAPGSRAAGPSQPAPTPSAELPDTPFTAWTTTSPLTIVGPGGTTEGVVRGLGVRVEVLQVLAGRMRVKCTGCEDPELEGWLPLESVRAVGGHGELTDPLSVALRLRAAWAGGSNLPEGADNSGMCSLIDHGSQPGGDPQRLVWAHGSGRLELEWGQDAWEVGTLTAPAPGSGWSCRTTRPRSL